MASAPRGVPANPLPDIGRELVAVRAELDLLRAAINRAEVERLSARITRLETMLALADPTRLIQEIVTLREQVAELKRWREATQRREWTSWLIVAFIMLASNTVVACILYFVREPG